VLWVHRRFVVLCCSKFNWGIKEFDKGLTALQSSSSDTTFTTSNKFIYSFLSRFYDEKCECDTWLIRASSIVCLFAGVQGANGSLMIYLYLLFVFRCINIHHYTACFILQH
jgi:hypothetical protein